jgi:hypothetical protein
MGPVTGVAGGPDPRDTGMVTSEAHQPADGLLREILTVERAKTIDHVERLADSVRAQPKPVCVAEVVFGSNPDG